MVRYIIWGTGKHARNFIAPYIDTYFRENPIVGFIDNNLNKEGMVFLGSRIYRPEYIPYISYDNIIIGSTFYDEILSQITQMGIKSSCVKSVSDVTKDMRDFYVKKYPLGSRVFVIGSYTRYLQMEHEYRALFNVVGTSEVSSLKEIKKYKWDYILLMEGKNLLEDSDITFEELTHILLKDYNVSIDNIISEAIYLLISTMDIPMSAGEDFPDKCFLVIHASGTAGLGSIVNVVAKNVNYANENNLIPVVDLYSYPNAYLDNEEVGKVNAWEKFFYQPGGYSMQDIKRAKNVLWSSVDRLGIELKNLDFLQVRKELINEIESYCGILFQEDKKYLGVLFRGTDYVNRKPFHHCIQPSLEEMVEMVRKKKEEWKTDEIYLCTEVKEAVETFQKEFGEHVYFYPQKRYSSRCNQYLSTIRFKRENDAYIRGASYWVLLNALARCHCLVAGNCGGTNIALLLNKGKYEHTYIFQLGRYGIDDVT